jgi:small subunit ribosomal protein S16
MLVIRLQRTGRRNEPTYRLVVADKRSAVKGSIIENLGHYLPSRESPVFECNVERIVHWVGAGAAPSDTVARLLTKNSISVKGLEKYIKRYTKQRSKSAPVEEAAKPAPAAPVEAKKEEAPAAEAPAEEKKE